MLIGLTRDSESAMAELKRKALLERLELELDLQVVDVVVLSLYIEGSKHL